jgi:hypothetical protein
MQGICTGSGWRKGALHLEIRGAEKSLIPLTPGAEFSMAVFGKRSCIGYRPPDASSLIPCPDKNDDISASQCPSCFERAKILPCLRCDGERCRNPDRRDFCVQPDNHALYLASFGPGVLKVGVARWERRLERVQEQGARAAVVVAREDGQIVRRVENQIKRIGIPDRIAPGIKLDSLTKSGKRDQLESELLDALGKIRQRVRANWVDPEPLPLAAVEKLDFRPQQLYPANEFSLRGKITTTIGQMIIVSSPELFAIEASSLVGYHLGAAQASDPFSGQMAIPLSQ